MMKKVFCIDSMIFIGIMFLVVTNCKKEEHLSSLKSSKTIVADSLPGPTDYVAVNTEPATYRTEHGVTLNGTVFASSVPRTVMFEYGKNEDKFQTVAAEPGIVPGVSNPGNACTHIRATITGLKRGTYVYRVKAVDSFGIALGWIYTVDILGTGSPFPTVTTLAATNLLSHTATLNATVNPDSLETGVWFEYGTTTDYGAFLYGNSYSEDSIINAIINVSITGDSFENGITYHYRACAGNIDERAYGEDKEFTISPIQVPEVTTVGATIINPSSAILNGTVNANNASSIVTFEYGTSISYGQEVTAEQSPVSGNTSIDVSATLTGLTCGIYNYRVKAVSSIGTSYGDNMIFNSANLPTVTTTPVSGITGTTAITGGNISDDGWCSIVDRGVQWSTSSQAWTHRFERGGPKDYDTHDGAGTGSFTSNLTGLQPGTTYYVRAYANNGYRFAAGNIISFTTVR